MAEGVQLRHAMLALSFAMAMMCAAAQPPHEVAVRLAIPKGMTTPVLIIDDLEFQLGHRMTIEVLGPVDRKTGKRPILAVEGITGSNRPRKDAPTRTMKLVVPLNEEAARLTAKQKEITLTLRRRDKKPLKFRSAYLEAPPRAAAPH